MISTFFAWWLEQLRELLPAALRRTARGADALIIVPNTGLGRLDTVSVALRRGGKETALGEFAATPAGLRDLPRSSGRPVALRLEKNEFLEKTLVLPLAAQADLDQVLAFEMDRETPFKAEELYWNHQIAATDRQRQQLAVRLLLLPKTRLAQLMAALGAAGFAPAWAEIADDGDCPPLPLDGGASRRSDGARRLLWPAAACCGLLAASAVAIPFVQQAAVLSALDREVHAGEATAARAEALRRQIDRASHSADIVNGEMEKAGRPLEILAKLTRILPDDTYLTNFELRQGKLTINGRSGGAARLIGALATDGGFRNPTFAAPVTRLESVHAEVFTIAADVGKSP